MASPEDTLVAMIEAAAALAGFAGIVATLKRERFTRLDNLQMENLLSCAFSALFVSILARGGRWRQSMCQWSDAGTGSA